MNTLHADNLARLAGLRPADASPVAALCGTDYEKGRQLYRGGWRVYACENEEQRAGWCAAAASARDGRR